MNLIDYIILFFSVVGMGALAGMFAAGFADSPPMFFACIGVAIASVLLNKFLARRGNVMKP